jgi:hypothetical protein
MPFKVKALVSAAGTLIASALIAARAKAARKTPDDAPSLGSHPDIANDLDPTPPDRLTAERIEGAISGKVTYGTHLGWDGKRLRWYPFAQAEVPPVSGPGAPSQ